MGDFLVALGLVLVVEGLFYGALPSVARRLAQEVLRMPDSVLRVTGVVAMVAGVVIVWAVRR